MVFCSRQGHRAEFAHQGRVCFNGMMQESILLTHTGTYRQFLMVTMGSSDVWEMNGQSSNTKCLRKKRLCLWYKDDVCDRRVSYTAKYSYCAGGGGKPGLPATVTSLCYGTDIQPSCTNTLCILLPQSLGMGRLFRRDGRWSSSWWERA